MIDLCCIYVAHWDCLFEPSRLEQRWFASPLEREFYVLRTRLVKYGFSSDKYDALCATVTTK